MKRLGIAGCLFGALVSVASAHCSGTNDAGLFGDPTPLVDGGVSGSTGSGGSAAGSAGTAGAAPCASGERCGAECVDTQSRADHCGGCNRGCPVGASCSAGA